MLTKMDMCWIATAILTHPHTESNFLVTMEQIGSKVKGLFGSQITPVMITKHLVSWEDQQADKDYPKRGGSRNRYLFQTLDGQEPSKQGKFRLYKRADAIFDGMDKTSKAYPDRSMIPSEYHYLLDWYERDYFG